MNELYVTFRDPDVTLAYATGGAAGLDLCAAKGPWEHDCWQISAGSWETIDCGIDVAIPPGHVGLISIRSGHGFKRQLVAHDGRLDEDYRGPVRVKVFNLGTAAQVIQYQERFAQLVLVPVTRVRVVPVQDVATAFPTQRGTRGFGST